MLSEPHKLFKLIWQKKKYCDYKSWTHFFFTEWKPMGAVNCLISSILQNMLFRVLEKKVTQVWNNLRVS